MFNTISKKEFAIVSNLRFISWVEQEKRFIIAGQTYGPLGSMRHFLTIWKQDIAKTGAML